MQMVLGAAEFMVMGFHFKQPVIIILPLSWYETLLIGTKEIIIKKKTISLIHPSVDDHICVQQYSFLRSKIQIKCVWPHLCVCAAIFVM